MNALRRLLPDDENKQPIFIWLQCVGLAFAGTPAEEKNARLVLSCLLAVVFLVLILYERELILLSLPGQPGGIVGVPLVGRALLDGLDQPVEAERKMSMQR